MRVRRLLTALSVCLAASASTAAAQPKADPKKAPAAPAKAPAKDPAKDAKAPAPAPAPAPGPGGEVVQMSEDTPPADIEGKDENPDAPRTIGEEPAPVVVKQAAPKPTGYPIEEAMRPITLPKNMSEVSIGPHAQFSPYQGSDALRARYGITNEIQIGLTYVLGGIYDDPATGAEKIGFHPGKAVGLDLTVMVVKNWLAVRAGIPVYINPLALGLTLGAPMKWQFADGKYALGALDDLLNIRLYRFLPSFYQEAANASGAFGTGEMGNNTIQSRGSLRFAGYGVMQYQPKLAFIARLGVTLEDFATTRSQAGDNSGLRSFIRAGLQYSVRKYLDLGLSVGFDDLARAGSFGPAGLLAFRI
ncbi:MAG TPA: hypothetical protein VNO30_07120 [Kofleriaceae bacterium]|nr:hypothetical protein [Kofleriaceae bacterium]